MKYFKYIFLAIILTSLVQKTPFGSRGAIKSSFLRKSETNSSLFLTPFRGFEKQPKSHEEVASDMETIAKIAKVRTYIIADAQKVLESIGDTKLKTDVGLWLPTDKGAMKAGIETLFELIKYHGPKIATIIVGNEVLLRADLTSDELIEYIDRIKACRIPVTTAEVQHVWLTNQAPQNMVILFVCTSSLTGKKFLSLKHSLLHKKNTMPSKPMYPNKPITVGEFGWPSSGYNNEQCRSNAANQISAITSFLRDG